MNFGSEFCACDERFSLSFVIQRRNLLGDHFCIMFHLRMQRKYGNRNVCRFFIRATGASQSVTTSLQSVRFEHVAQLALVEFFDLNLANYIERSSLMQEWRRRFGFFAFHLHSKKSPA